MKILLRFCLLFTVSSALARAYDSKIGQDESEIHDEEVKLWQFMTDDVEGHNDGHEDGENNEDGFPLEPTKHPYKVREQFKSPSLVEHLHDEEALQCLILIHFNS